jgi:hypothetical protein
MGVMGRMGIMKTASKESNALLFTDKIIFVAANTLILQAFDDAILFI